MQNWFIQQHINSSLLRHITLHCRWQKPSSQQTGMECERMKRMEASRKLHGPVALTKDAILNL